MSQGSTNISFERFDASAYRMGIVVAGFNKDITDKLLESSYECLLDYNVKKENIDVRYVAGSIEIPIVLQAMAKSGKYFALVAFGAIIRGDTAHFDYVAKAVTEGVMRVSLDNSIPIGFGVLTLENKKQAEERLHTGYSATEAALQSAFSIKSI